MRVYEMTHGDALVILKNRRAGRAEIIKALEVLLTFDNVSEIRSLEKKELRRLIEFVTEKKMNYDDFMSSTREELLLVLKKEYFCFFKDNCRKMMDIDEAQNYLKFYISSDNKLKEEELSDAIETILWCLLRSRRRIIELEALTKDFQIGTVKRRNARKKVEQ